MSDPINDDVFVDEWYLMLIDDDNEDDDQDNVDVPYGIDDDNDDNVDAHDDDACHNTFGYYMT